MKAQEQIDAEAVTDGLNIHAFAELVGLTDRTVRRYLELGLLEPPIGRGRGARYNAKHVRRVREIQGLARDGWTLQKISHKLNPALPVSSLMHAPSPRTVQHYQLAPGVNLMLDPVQHLLPQASVERLVLRVLSACRRHR